MDDSAKNPNSEYEVLQNVPTTSDNYMPYYENTYSSGNQQRVEQTGNYGYTIDNGQEKPNDYEENTMEDVGDEEDDEQDSQQNPRYTPPTMTPKKLGVLLDQERFLPIANVARIMKTRCEPGTKISKDAKECVQECLSEFISFLTSEAAEYCHQTKRKTITADDLLTALEALGFDNYAEPMRITLAKYRQANKITGPIHREHEHYQRPEQFMNDPPFRPLFFDTENGSRCTETRFFNIESGSVSTDAPLGTEWQEQRQEQIPQQPPPQATLIKTNKSQQYQTAPQSAQQQSQQQQQTSTPIAQPGTLPITALEQQTQMQIYVDASTKQHYAAMDTENGVQLYPIQISSSAPITLTNASNIQQSSAIPSTSTSSQPTYMYLPDGDAEKGNETDQQPQQQYYE
ncbi:unnamed protein product [Caenorhabditis angaria]|uniref:Transcription factor CBF/NF-Y/archaeal histone domain-containing protein n=1 Tax=Caenorhabditis angaria TaxID=860376 RepID=A0A9P1IBV4_9PELO|nr:unnamed protein product [Caenorhabditis angaria]